MISSSEIILNPLRIDKISAMILVYYFLGNGVFPLNSALCHILAFSSCHWCCGPSATVTSCW